MTQTKSIFKLGALALTTALTAFSFEAQAQSMGNLDQTVGTFDTVVDRATKTTDITAHQNLTVGTGDINIRAGHTVNINQLGSGSVFAAVDNVAGSDTSKIVGTLNSNGIVMLFDRNGVVFGKDSKIDTAGIVASTGDLNISKFAGDGTVEISNFESGSQVIINGDISVKTGGLAAFVAPTVINRGIITAKKGRVELAGSNTKTTIDLYGDGLLEIALDETNTEKLEVLHGTTGVINAEDGVVHMTTGAAEQIVDSIVNMNGVVNARSAKKVGGKIILGGSRTGKVRIVGQADASGKKGGGEIKVTAKDVELLNPSVLDARARKNGDGGTITVDASNDAFLRGKFDARGGKKGGDGGTINTSATNGLSFGVMLDVNASAKNGNGGQWIIDPLVLDVKGPLANAWNASLNNGTSIDATATNDVMVNAALTWTGAASLTLNGGQKILVNKVITGEGDVTLNAPEVRLAADIDTTGVLSGTATSVFVENTSAQIQDGVDVAAVNARVNVAAGTFAENVNINKGIEIVGVSRDHTIIDASGGQNGFTISGDLGDNNVTLEKMAIKNAQRDGVHVAGTANLNNLRLSAMLFENNGWRGSAVFGDSVKGRTQIVNSLFFNNGSASTAKGDGDILFYHHAGDISLGNVTVQGNTGGLADYGVQIIGNPTKTESGTIFLNNLNVSGQYRVANLGIQQYDGIKSLSMKNVKLGGQTNAGNSSVSTAGWGGALFLSNLGEANLDLENTEFRAHDSNYIVLGAYNGNAAFTDTNIDATKATFLGKLGSDMTLAENFAVEDKVGHKMDFAPFGLVTWNAGNLYATQKSETGFSGAMQRGVDASDVNGNIYVEGGNFVGNINVNKSVKLYGAQAGVDARGRAATETVIVPNSPGMTVTANNVVVDGFKVENGTNGFVVDGADNVQIVNNIANKNTDTGAGRAASGWKTGVGIIVKDGASNVTVKNNSMDENTDGVRVVEAGANIVVEENDVNNSKDKGIIIKQTNGTKVLNNDLDGNKQGIRINIADSTNASNNIITNTTNEGILVDNKSDKTRLVDNEITGGTVGIHIKGGVGNIVDDNDVKAFKSEGVKVDGGANGTKVTDNFIQSFEKDTVGVLVDGALNTQVGGVGNALRNRIYDVDFGVVVDGGDKTKVQGNDIRRAVGGVLALGASGLEVLKNTVANATDVGIDITQSDSAKIIDNAVKDSNIGIYVEGGMDVVVDDNDLLNFDDAGVVLERTVGADVTDNLIKSTKTETIGIDLIDTVDTQIGGDGNTLRNRIYDVETGVLLSGDTKTTIDGNDFQRVDVGVASNIIAPPPFIFSDDLVVTDNTFKDGGLAMAIINAEGAVIGGKGDANIITNNGGILVVDSKKAKITHNELTNARFTNAITVVGSKKADVNDNIINGTDADANGIKIVDSNKVDVKRNVISNVGDDGIDVEGSNNITIASNEIYDAGEDGIDLEYSHNAVIKKNKVFDAAEGGIDLYASNDSKINKNKIKRSGDNGIVIQASSDAVIKKNNIRKSGEAGILVDGSFGTHIEENKLVKNDVGVEVRGSDRGGRPAFGAAISVGDHISRASDQTVILNNIIDDSKSAGVKTTGDAVNRVTLSKNQLDNNTIGMLFEGGEIDISDLLNPNIIKGGDTAMRFAPIDVLKPVEVAPGDFFEVKEIEFESVPAPLSLVNNTLGATIFDGTRGNYVELANGALFAPGSPTNIDGLAASFDGLVPLNSDLGPGFIRASDRTRIENKIVDFDDNTTLGQIIVGLDLDASEEDIFGLNLFSLQPENINVNVTFRGMPPVNTLDINALANIETAAGGDGEQSPEDLANLEPAAGGEEGCWAAVGQGAGFDGPVTFSFGSDIESAIAGADCVGQGI